MKVFLKLIFLLLPFTLFSQAEKGYSVYLIGDAGEDTISGKALLMLKDELLNDPNSTVVFLGDNIYPSGLKLNDRHSELCIQSQLNILKKYKGRAYFIPGNHDWNAQKRNGLARIKDEGVYIDNFLKERSLIKNKDDHSFLPGNGLPGPSTVMLDEKLRLIIIDTQWFLHFYKKNKVSSIKQTRFLFYKHLDSLLTYSGNNQEQVIIAGHHPMFTNGAHSRKAQPFRFLVNYSPFQIFGLMGLNRLFSQDLSQPRYRRMKKRMMNSFNQHDNIVYASGHDHNLQFFKEKSNKYIVSGCGSKTEHFRKQRFPSVYQDDSKAGFVKLEYFPNKKMRTTIYRVGVEPEILKDY